MDKSIKNEVHNKKYNLLEVTSFGISCFALGVSITVLIVKLFII